MEMDYTMEMFMGSVCDDCIYFERGDSSVGLPDGCNHDFLYDEDGDIIDENEEIILGYMSSGICPLKEKKKKIK